MSLYADYMQELANKTVLETNSGFIIYSFTGDICYIEEIYVIPSARGHHVAKDMADHVTKIAQSKGCKTIAGSVSLLKNNPHDSLLVLIAYGMKLHSAAQNMVYFTKAI